MHLLLSLPRCHVSCSLNVAQLTIGPGDKKVAQESPSKVDD